MKVQYSEYIKEYFQLSKVTQFKNGQRHTHQRNQIWKRHMHPNVHRSTVYHSQDMEAT